jgi:hypothetical protein
MTDSQGVVAAWHKEALRRAEEIDCGLVDTVSAEESRCEASKLLILRVGLTPESEQTIAANVAGILSA